MNERAMRIIVILCGVLLAVLTLLIWTMPVQGQGPIQALDVGGWRASGRPPNIGGWGGGGPCPPGTVCADCKPGGTPTVPQRMIRPRPDTRCMDPNCPVHGRGGTQIQQTSPQLPTEQVQATRPARVRIRVVSGNSWDIGSGIVTRSRGRQVWILTCFHIFRERTGPIGVYVPGRPSPYVATIVDQSPEHDVAIITCEAGPIEAVCMGTEKPAKGSQVRAGGYGRGLTWRWNSGVVTGYVGPSPGMSMTGIQTTATVGDGDSGGPILDMSGCIVGVISARDPSPNMESGALGCANPMLRQLVSNFVSPAELCGTLPPYLADEPPQRPIVEGEEPETLPVVPDLPLPIIQPPQLWAPMEDVVRNTEAITEVAAVVSEHAMAIHDLKKMDTRIFIDMEKEGQEIPGWLRDELDELQERVATIGKAKSLELVQGPAGRDGRDGTDGSRGLQGRTGTRGGIGPRGEPGLLVRLTADQYTEAELQELAESLLPHLPPFYVEPIDAETGKAHPLVPIRLQEVLILTDSKATVRNTERIEQLEEAGDGRPAN